MNFNCRVCGHSQIKKEISVKEARNRLGLFFDYFVCANCETLSIKNIPNNLDVYYKGYYSFQDIKKVSLFQKTIFKMTLGKSPQFLKKLLSNFFLRKENDFKLKSILPVSPQKNWKILDVGSGTGDFIHLLHELGYHNSVGIDPYLEQSIHYQNGAKVIKKNIFEIEEQFDLITFHHSFEHIDNARLYIDKIKSLLKSDGVCLIRLPSIDCSSYKLFEEHWVGIHAPYHTFIPSYKGMQELLNQYELKISSYTGEQILDFFLMSKEMSLGITDDEKSSIRALVRQKKSFKHSPWHSKKEISGWKNMKKFVEKNNACDCVAYYIKHA